MDDRQGSAEVGSLSPEQEARQAEREVGIDGERGEMDREREALRMEVVRHAERVHGASADLLVACSNVDDHRMIEELRRLLALGLQSKPLADQMEKLLPQPSRLFAPPA